MADMLVEITKDFLQMEAENPRLIDACVLENGLNYWPVLRVLFWECFSNPASTLYTGYMAGKISLVQSVFSLQAETQNALRKIPAGGCAYFSRAHCHAFQIEGKMFDPYLDPIAFVAQRQGVVPVKFHIATHKEWPQYYLKPLVLPFTAAEKIWDIGEVAIFPGYNAYVQASLVHKVPVLPFSAVARSVLDVFAYAKLFEEIFTAMRPSMVLLEEYYNTVAQGLALACRRLGIPCIEYQHGIQDGHIAYNFSYIPEQGFPTLPEWFFTWGEYDATRYEKIFAQQKFHKAAVAGKPMYLAWKLGRLAEPAELVASLQRFVTGKKSICVPLQGNFIPFPELEILIQESPQDWVWLLRQHPLLYLDVEPLLQKFPGRVETVAASALSLHTVLDMSQHVVFQQSSVAVEAEYLHGLQSTTFSEDAQFFFEESISKGSVYYATSIEDGLRNIHTALQAYPYTPPEPNHLTRDEQRLGVLIRLLYLQWQRKQAAKSQITP